MIAVSYHCCAALMAWLALMLWQQRWGWWASPHQWWTVRPIVVGEFVHGSSRSRQHLVVDIDTWPRRRRRKIVQRQQTSTPIDNVKVGGRGIISGGCKKLHYTTINWNLRGQWQDNMTMTQTTTTTRKWWWWVRQQRRDDREYVKNNQHSIVEKFINY